MKNGAWEMGAGWGPLVLVTGHGADVRVSVCWEPDAGTGRAMRCLGREDFIDGPLWIRRQGRGEMPELSCMDRPGWRGLYGGADELLEMRAKHGGKLDGRDVSSVGLSEGPQGGRERDHGDAVPVDGVLGMWSVGWFGNRWGLGVG